MSEYVSKHAWDNKRVEFQTNQEIENNQDKKHLDINILQTPSVVLKEPYLWKILNKYKQLFLYYYKLPIKPARIGVFVFLFFSIVFVLSTFEHASSVKNMFVKKAQNVFNIANQREKFVYNRVLLNTLVPGVAGEKNSSNENTFQWVRSFKKVSVISGYWAENKISSFQLPTKVFFGNLSNLFVSINTTLLEIPSSHESSMQPDLLKKRGENDKKRTLTYEDAFDVELEKETGIVVVPVNGVEEKDFLKEKIADSFSDESDEVEVVPDETGSAGFVKPVFKKPSDQEYLFVMVPQGEGV